MHVGQVWRDTYSLGCLLVACLGMLDSITPVTLTTSPAPSAQAAGPRPPDSSAGLQVTGGSTSLNPQETGVETRSSSQETGLPATSSPQGIGAPATLRPLGTGVSAATCSVNLGDTPEWNQGTRVETDLGSSSMQKATGIPDETARAALKELDLAAMMGGPRFRTLVNAAVVVAEAALSHHQRPTPEQQHQHGLEGNSATSAPGPDLASTSAQPTASTSAQRPWGPQLLTDADLEPSSPPATLPPVCGPTLERVGTFPRHGLASGMPGLHREGTTLDGPGCKPHKRARLSVDAGEQGQADSLTAGNMGLEGGTKGRGPVGSEQGASDEGGLGARERAVGGLSRGAEGDGQLLPPASLHPRGSRLHAEGDGMLVPRGSMQLQGSRRSVEGNSALLPPGSLQPPGSRPPVEELPSLEHFLVEYMLAGDAGIPLVITGRNGLKLEAPLLVAASKLRLRCVVQPNFSLGWSLEKSPGEKQIKTHHLPGELMG
jgi:hypothetical protein